MAYTSNPGSSQEPKSLREFSKSCHPFYPAAPFFQVGFALVLSVVLNFVLFCFMPVMRNGKNGNLGPH